MSDHQLRQILEELKGLRQDIDYQTRVLLDMFPEGDVGDLSAGVPMILAQRQAEKEG